MNPISLFDQEEFSRWWEQAKHTISSAQRDVNQGDFAWGSFKAQQAAEYSIKALIRGIGRIAVGHSTLKLLEELAAEGFQIEAEVLAAARLIDRHYIPPRYPDAYPAGSPFEFYDLETAQEAISAAQKIMTFVEEVINPASSSKPDTKEDH